MPKTAPRRRVRWLTSADLVGLPCDRRVQLAWLSHPHGWRLPHAALGGCFGGSLEHRPQGSQNWPPMAFMYSVLTAQENAAKLLPYFRGAGGWGLGGSEGQSLIYGVWPWVTALVLYPELDGELRHACRVWLRAVVARLTLSARPEIPETVKYRLGAHREGLSRRRTEAAEPGLFIHAPGERSATHDGWWIRRSHLHGFLSAALGVPWRPPRPLGAPHFPYPEPPASDWPLALADWQLDGRLLRGSAAASWGLRDSERQAARRFLLAPSPQNAAPLLEWLRPFGAVGGTQTWRYYESGALVVVASRSTSHVKTGQGAILLAAVRGDGRLAWRVSATSPADSLQQSFAHLGSAIVSFHSRRGDPFDFPLRRFGRLRFTVEHRPNGVHLREG